ncbi:RdgB/HAM1 family non-canonical purine NTP pyrophosphatase [Desulfurococcus mucosus]|uniref:dITP/XTP pyrophosphatase n=1 Tax=Desulfurococcus mucosus (strain ATCC 35584 / DSM 2162 / JCM 9187 / O7/1) TaxID=765177 RepID=E8R7F9_DESM0|nr:RdgB/HAM1 family non-canonical purine NTP pyrophosphatase [Desulfurococcus mucosus]ADV65624.1 dITPase [Desulfurococcus mucosus DSM 2162]
MIELLLLSGNKHKYAEIAEVAGRYGVKVTPLEGFKVEIQDDDLSRIALTAALIGYSILGKPVLVEDAGLFIKALNGFPGPYSSYVFKTLGVHGILKLMEGVAERDACFKSVAVAVVDGNVVKGYGEVCGYITVEPKGSRGFGFDPIFTPRDQPGRTFAEMDVAEKNKYSHRAKAVAAVFEKVGSLLGVSMHG